MATEKRRLNITLTNEVDRAVSYLADRDNVPQATKVSELLQRALEIEEDAVWDRIAGKRDTRKARLVSHDKAWA